MVIFGKQGFGNNVATNVGLVHMSVLGTSIVLESSRVFIFQHLCLHLHIYKQTLMKFHIFSDVGQYVGGR